MQKVIIHLLSVLRALSVIYLAGGLLAVVVYQVYTLSFLFLVSLVFTGLYYDIKYSDLFIKK